MECLRRACTILLVISFLALIPVHPLFSGGGAEGSSKTGIISPASSSDGNIYSVDYTPPRSIKINDVHYIQIRIYDSLSNYVNDVYYLKSSDRESRQNILNIQLPDNIPLPDNRFNANLGLTLVIDYYDVDNVSLGLVNEQFEYSFHLGFETIKNGENGLGPYRRSSKIFLDLVDEMVRIITESRGIPEPLPTEEYFVNIAEEIQELRLESDSVHILLETVIFYDEEYDVNKIKEDSERYTGQLEKFSEILSQYLSDNFPHKIGFSDSEEKPGIESIVRYVNQPETADAKTSPYVRIYLISREDDLMALKKSSFENSKATIHALKDAYIAAEVRGIDAEASYLLTESLLPLFEKNKQLAKAFLGKNSEYAAVLSQFHESLESAKKELEDWLSKQRGIIAEAIENRERSKIRIGVIQERVKEMQESIAAETSRDIAADSMRKELEFLQEEEARVSRLPDSVNEGINAVIAEVNGRIAAFNRAHNPYMIVTEDSDEGSSPLGSYSFSYGDEKGTGPDRITDMENFTAVLNAVIGITEKEQESIGSHLRYMPHLGESEGIDDDAFTAAEIVDNLQKTLNTLKENYEKFNDTVKTQIQDVMASDEFDTVSSYRQEIDEPGGIPPSSPLIDHLEKIVEINQFFGDVMSLRDSSLQVVYDAIASLPSDGETLLPVVDKAVDTSEIPSVETVRQDPGSEEVERYPLLVTGQFNPDIDSVISRIAQKNPSVEKDEISHIVYAYFSEALAEDVNPLVAIAQMLYHTKYLAAKGIMEKTYNFGLLGSNDENSFSSRSEGIRAHVQHIKAYSKAKIKSGSIVDPRYAILEREGLTGTKTFLRELVDSWYVEGRRDKAYAGIVAILELLGKI